MSIISSTAHSTDSGFYDYPINQSLRFDGSSYLSRTSQTGASDTTATISFWVKRAKLSVRQLIFVASNNSTNASYIIFEFKSDDTFRIINAVEGGSATGSMNPSNLFRDTSAWYHFVCVLDGSNATSSNRLSIYINGNLAIAFTATPSYPSSTYIDENQYIGYGGSSLTNDFANLYLANIQFIDGQALSASSFGETKSGVWTPKAYTGSYGTNGFHLTFSNASNLGEDSSGNNNDWTVN